MKRNLKELRSAVFLFVLLTGATLIGWGQDGAAAGGPEAPSDTELTEALLERARSYNGDELMAMADDTLFPGTYVATMRMTTERPGRRTTEMVFESSYQDGRGTFMEVTEPRRSRGMRFLQKEDDLWMYNPRSSSRRAIRLAPRDSFQGSVFSNNDVSDPKYADDYRGRLGDVETIDHPQHGRVQTLRIDAEASHDQSAYGRIEMWLWPDPEAAASDGDDSPLRVIPLRIDYHSRSGLLFKRMTLLDIRELAGARRPAVMRMESLEEEGAVTTVRIESLEARDSLPSRLFSQQELTR
jgi:hypothetical protein